MEEGPPGFKGMATLPNTAIRFTRNHTHHLSMLSSTRERRTEARLHL